MVLSSYTQGLQRADPNTKSAKQDIAHLKVEISLNAREKTKGEIIIHVHSSVISAIIHHFYFRMTHIVGAFQGLPCKGMLAI